jgi:hypothetical protein
MKQAQIIHDGSQQSRMILINNYFSLTVLMAFTVQYLLLLHIYINMKANIYNINTIYVVHIK